MSDLNYNINATVTGADEVEGLADDLERIGDEPTINVDASGVTETAESLESISTSTADEKLGDIGEAADSAGGLGATAATAFGDLVNAIGLVTIASAGADFVMDKIGERLDYIAATDAWEAGRVNVYADAIAEVGTGVAAIEEVIRALADQPVQATSGLFGLGGGSEIENIAATLGFFGINVQEVVDVVQGGQPELDAFEQRLDAVGATGSLGSQIMGTLANEQVSYGEATAEAGYQATFFAESQESANRALQDLLDNRDPMSQFTDEWDLLKESMSDGSIDTTAAANALNTLSEGLNLTTEEVLKLAQADLDEAAAGALAFAEALNSIDFDNTDIEGATNAFAAYTDQLFAAGNEAERRESAFDALAASAENQALTFNVASEAGRAQSDALEQVARVIDEDLAEAYDNANGSQAEFIAAATQIGDETLARLQTELGLTDAQVETLRNTLGLTATDYAARFNLAGAEEARLQLELLGGAIEGLPTDIEQTVTQQILAGDFVAARDTVANYYADNPVELPTEVDSAGADSDIQTKILGVAPEKVAIISTSADTVGADTELDLVALEVRTATIDTEADTTAAGNELFALVNQQRTAEVDVATGSVALPTASQLAASIGTVRVQIQGVWSSRIEGSRPR